MASSSQQQQPVHGASIDESAFEGPGRRVFQLSGTASSSKRASQAPDALSEGSNMDRIPPGTGKGRMKHTQVKRLGHLRTRSNVTS